MIGTPISDRHNSLNDNDIAMYQDSRPHALPTSDPDLAFIVGTWDRLADECKARLIEIIRENLPS
ncbi:MAG: hypothetical protein ACLP53_24235 [Isosphaeraceae bacterium]